MTPLADRIARTIRQDVQSMHGYAIQPSAGMVKLDAMENPFRLPPELQRELGERLGEVAINRYPATDRRGRCARWRASSSVPAGCKLMLGNGSDELIDAAGGGLRRAGRDGAGAAARLRDVRDVGASCAACASSACR